MVGGAVGSCTFATRRGGPRPVRVARVREPELSGGHGRKSGANAGSPEASFPDASLAPRTAHTAVAVLAAAWLLAIGPVLLAASIVMVVASVLAAVHHAEVVAHRVGEPFGTLVLALAITAIEVALIVSLMLAGGSDQSALARDTIYATVMIIVSGVVGICVLLGGLRHHEQVFRIEGAGPAFAALVTLATLVLILPVFTSSAPGSGYSGCATAFRGDSRHLCSGWSSFFSRPCGIATTSCRRAIGTTRKCMRRHRAATCMPSSACCCS